MNRVAILFWCRRNQQGFHDVSDPRSSMALISVLTEHSIPDRNLLAGRRMINCDRQRNVCRSVPQPVLLTWPTCIMKQ